jgi:hypothetical protein
MGPIGISVFRSDELRLGWVSSLLREHLVSVDIR